MGNSFDRTGRARVTFYANVIVDGASCAEARLPLANTGCLASTEPPLYALRDAEETETR
jgi:hypothetical protein